MATIFIEANLGSIGKCVPLCIGNARKEKFCQMNSKILLNGVNKMWELQKDIIAQTRRFLPGRQKLGIYEKIFWDRGDHSLMHYIDTEEYEMLCQLQHYGGATNLIDFTTDYFVALFFACEQNYSVGGRIILSEITPLPVRISDSRVQAQKSVFVQAPDGFMKSDHVKQIKIAARLKIPLLLYLKQYHAISSETLFPDIQGAIRHWNANQSVLFRLHEADRKNTQKQFDEAAKIYNECFSLSVDLDPSMLVNQSIFQIQLEGLEKVPHDDLTKAIMIIKNDWRWHHGEIWGFALFFSWHGPYT